MDESFNLFNFSFCKCANCREAFEQLRRCLVHALISTLRAQDHCNAELVGLVVMQRTANRTKVRAQELARASRQSFRLQGFCWAGFADQFQLHTIAASVIAAAK